MGRRGKDLRRVQGRRSTDLIVIFSEDEKSSKLYLEALRRASSSSKKIHIQPGKGKDAKSLILKAKEYCKRQELRSSDLVYILCDVDDKDDAALELLCRQAKTRQGPPIRLILSNPSFELWYLLHFVDHRAWIQRDALIRKLEQFLGEYDKGKSYYGLLCSKGDEVAAIERAKALNLSHECSGTALFSAPSNPSTQVFEVVAAMGHGLPRKCKA